jgi:hypothetical protein
MPDVNATVYVFGEGKTDIGGSDESELPTKGVVPILVHALCDKPGRMRVKREPVAFLEGKGLWQKVRCAKRRAYYGKADAAVFVVDSEGNAVLCKTKHDQVRKGRDAALPDFPMAVGIAHPCIEAWLLADAAAIRRCLDLGTTPAVIERPEELPAPCLDGKKNPKAMLREIAKRGISVNDKDRIAAAMNLSSLRQRCPLGFAPFADEVEKHIHPLFQEPCSPE